MHKDTPALSSAAEEALRRHPWPGNIRELENVMQLALLMSNSPELRPEDLNLADATGDDVGRPSGPVDKNRELSIDNRNAPHDAIASHLRRGFSIPGEALYGELERLIVTEAYHYCGRNQVQSAELLGVSRNAFRTLLKRHGQLAATAKTQIESTSAPEEMVMTPRAWVMEASLA
jgi:DNA-binding NtrC family response regulator